MARKEQGITDKYVDNQLKKLNVKFNNEITSPLVEKALKGGSKSGNGGDGNPDFSFTSNDFLVIIEDKYDYYKLINQDESNNLIMNIGSKMNFATNGAVHYAQYIIEHSDVYKKIFAVGLAGDAEKHQLCGYFVGENQLIKLPSLEDFSVFSPDNIKDFYKVNVLGELSETDKQIKSMDAIASSLHEDLRNYGGLEGERKATIVSSILLALQSGELNLDDLTGKQGMSTKDGDKIYRAVEAYIENADFGPQPKTKMLLDQFQTLRTDTRLNTPTDLLDGLTPLHKFALTLKNDVIEHLTGTTDIDILGQFYGEFVKYGGNDGNALGIVLTPQHITSLMVELIDINPDDYVLDPATGTASFLIAAMHRMFKQSKSEEQRNDIRKNRLFGIEITAKLYTVATTNMILRGDGKSNLIFGDMFNYDDSKLNSLHHINKIIMNPPYSQGTKLDNYKQSEISFISSALDFAKGSNAKAAFIVPQSTMIGKTKVEKTFKKEILRKHTLESVITLNTDTFHGVGTNPVIAIFTPNKPHNSEKRVSFVDFRDDGYIVRKHVGLVGDGTQASKRKHLINVLNGNEDDTTKFIVKSTITPEDEWLHSFYYFNDELPTNEDFEKTIQDYLSFKFDMTVHGRGDLFDESE
ncbi:N-6 DNA methylase [Pediococcus pentosaceus]|uniref:HsdM family class I SAM-dependent methyltransferase n=1 Tax=Pediococcus pentosaceus TaxID=1255 RepID=UPI00190CA774|nr:N-6 DNA methylase [Pediococcus pentosaceus]MBF7125864.1 N-6 DNA methylase [Pediococcus pentosaceus]WPK15870.1 N-6 DNA methylase [Pediococcus pentosaceus]